MPGTEAIVGIYGEVDRAVQLDPLARLRVSQLLPEYQTPGVSWYDDFLTWLAETRAAPDFPRWLAESRGAPGADVPGKPFPNVTEALDTFTASNDFEVHHVLGAHPHHAAAPPRRPGGTYDGDAPR